MFDITKFSPTHTYYIEIDINANMYMDTDSGMRLYMPDDEGDIYQSKPFHGTLVAAPKKSKIALGETVYLTYQAYNTLSKQGEKSYYIVDESMIVGFGDPDNIIAFKSVIIDVHEIPDKILVDDLSDDELFDAVINGSNTPPPETNSATVIAADNEWLLDEADCDVPFDSGDEIEYQGKIDWEFFYNRKKRYFIKYANRIIKKNGELINRYVEVGHKPKYIDVNGILCPNTSRFYEAVGGKFEGNQILIDEKRLEINKYIKSDHIYGYVP